MNSLISDRLRGVVAVVLAGMVISIGVRPTLARTNDKHATPPKTAVTAGTASDTDKPPATNTEQDPPSSPAEKAPDAPPAPRLQLQDEGPPAGTSAGVNLSKRSRTAVADDTEERPFWKSWIFWAVTGALVAGGISLVAYSSSRTNSALAACPPDIVLSQGCFGAGRGR